MPAKNQDLHGNVPDHSHTALLLIDLINDFEFEGAEALFEHALPMARRIAALKQQAKQAGIPVIYINDNFGKWQSDLHKLVRHCLDEGVRGEPVVKLLQPEADDYFVLKPKHSGFYSTTLETLLAYLQAQTLILAGVAGNICILFTASDAFIRDFHLVIPADCVASNDAADNRAALELMRKVLKADIQPSTELNLAALEAKAARSRPAD